MERWKDPRTPVSVEYVGRYKITIFDLESYEQSKIDYPDDANDDKLYIPKGNKVPQFSKKKPASRWNWIVKPEQPLKGRLA